MSTYAPFAKPLYVMLKPVGAVCNLACDYCYYLEKSKLYQNNPKHVMSEELLEKFIEEYINSQTMPQVMFTWHGGETLMRPLSFYKKAMELQKKYARGRTIDNSIQTNGTMLTDEWCEFFCENNWLVGVSIDGPQEFHDEYRKNKQGKPSFVKVMQGINLLKKHGVEWNGMAVVNDYNADYPLEFYNFFKEIGCHYIQFAPIVERVFGHQDGRHLASLADREEVAELADFSISPEQWGNFLCTLFDEWVKKDVGTYYIQLFDSTLANWIGEQPGVCSMAKTCGHAPRVSWAKGVPSGWVMEQNIRTTLPCSGRHGSRAMVEASGWRNRSEFTSSPKPAMAEASMAMPYLKARSSSWGMMEIFLGLPKQSQNARRMNFTSS